MISLTPHQRAMMLAVQRTIDATGVAPSISELTQLVGLAPGSRSHVYATLCALQERGFIRRLPQRARAIEILQRVPDESDSPLTSALRLARTFVDNEASMRGDYDAMYEPTAAHVLAVIDAALGDA